MRKRKEFLTELWREYLELAEAMDKVNFFLPKSINSLNKFLDMYILVIVGFKQYVKQEAEDEKRLAKIKKEQAESC